MDATLTAGGTTASATKADIERVLASGEFFWLDLVAEHPDAPMHPLPPGGAPAPGSDEVTDLLLITFQFHPITVGYAEYLNQRPKLEDFDDYTAVVVHGATPKTAGTIELHLYLTTTYLVTIHSGPCPVLDDVRQRMDQHHAANAAPQQLVVFYLIVDALTDSFFPVLAAFDDEIDTLESAILVRPTDEQLGRLFTMKRTLMAIRKVVTPQRDMFAALSSGVTGVPGMTDASSRYFRDLYDHLIRISDMVDSYRDLLSGVMDTHLSVVSNRLNVVMKQLTIIATIFLPLSYLTGFFGQNFAWLVTRIGSLPAFLGIGIGTEVLAVIGLLTLFKRQGWM